MLILPLIGQGHHRVMIYIYIVVLESTCQVSLKSVDQFWRRGFLKDFYQFNLKYEHGGHHGHATWIIYMHIGSPLPI